MEEHILNAEARRRREGGTIRPIIFVTVLAAAIVLLASCSAGDPYVSVLEGNYAFGQGRYQEATVHYLEAMSAGSHKDWISYDLGNVYHALGEAEAALDMWDKASKATDDGLRYAVSYNRGVQYYELGDYQKAYDAFRKSLEYDPSSMDAKINLELALRKLQPSGESAAPQAVASNAKSNVSEQDSRRILEYVRRKEAQQWVPGEQQTPPPAANDY
ncbi:tetratricopeptide repeat protein [Salinispira pacifica]